MNSILGAIDYKLLREKWIEKDRGLEREAEKLRGQTAFSTFQKLKGSHSYFTVKNRDI